MTDQKTARQAGLALIIGSLLMFVTMILHPAGGGIEHIRKIYTLIIVTHSIAILSIPISLYGYWGLTKTLNASNMLNGLAFCIISVGLFAVMIAGTVNGLCLPLFVDDVTVNAETEASIEAILTYNFTVNKAMTYIYIVGSAIATLFWSIRIVKTGLLSKYLGYYGILLSMTGISLFISGFIFTDLYGFRIFIFGLVSWVLITGWQLLVFKPMVSSQDL